MLQQPLGSCKMFSVDLYLYEYGLGCRMSKQRSHRLICLGLFVQRFDRIFRQMKNEYFHL